MLKKAGVDGSQIKTWDDYYEAAKKVKAIGAYMTNNSGSSMEYQPFTARHGRPVRSRGRLMARTSPLT